MGVTFPDTLLIPAEVLRIAQQLEEGGWETWCVGGAIRDTLLHQENKDFDLATAATPEQVTKLFKRTIPIGKEHGTIAVVDRNGETHEVTTFRRDVKTDGRHAVVEFGVSLDEDLARRDFTINAIAYHPLTHEWRDRFGGAQDLEDGVIRAVGAAWHRFREDYLRILRALRFAARFGFTIEQATWKAAKACVAGLQHLSAERVREEWFQGLRTAQRPSELLRLWNKIGALAAWLPEIGSGERGEGPDGSYVIDRFETRDPVLITVHLSDDPGATLERLRCSRAEIERGRATRRFRRDIPNPESPAEVRRWMSRAASVVDDLLAIQDARGSGSRLRIAVDQIRESGAPLSVGELAIGGADLIAAGFKKGPVVGRVLKELLNEVLQEPELNTRSRLLERGRELMTSGPAPRSPLPDSEGNSPS